LGLSDVFLDTNILIYLLEDAGDVSRKAVSLLERMRHRRDTLATSAFSVAEVLVKPVAAGDWAWEKKYELLFDSPGMRILPFDRSCARLYAEIRKDRSIRAADAIQLACAGSARCNLFVTNDGHLSRKAAPGIDFIVSLEQAVAII
jgi:predicted nucleic acid-binding protein